MRSEALQNRKTNRHRKKNQHDERSRNVSAEYREVESPDQALSVKWSISLKVMTRRYHENKEQALPNVRAALDRGDYAVVRKFLNTYSGVADPELEELRVDLESSSPGSEIPHGESADAPGASH